MPAMPGPSDGLPRLYTSAEVAEALGCSPWWVDEQARRRRFPYHKVAGGHRFSADDYAVILRVCAVKVTAEHEAAEFDRPVSMATETASGGLRARVPRR